MFKNLNFSSNKNRKLDSIELNLKNLLIEVINKILVGSKISCGANGKNALDFTKANTLFELKLGKVRKQKLLKKKFKSEMDLFNSSNSKKSCILYQKSSCVFVLTNTENFSTLIAVKI